MKSLLLLPKIKVEQANAISGITYGFPSVTHFLGFVHSLWRDSKEHIDGRFLGVSIICHSSQLQSHQSGYWNDHYFSQARHPLTENGKTAPFNEEGKISMEISLLISCDFSVSNIKFDGDLDDDENEEAFCNFLNSIVANKRLAGGHIVDLMPVEFYRGMRDSEKREKVLKTLSRRLTPGFILMDRSDIFKEYLQKYPEKNQLEAILDFYSLTHEASFNSHTTDVKEEERKIEWKLVRPECKSGWMVPIQSGYRAISPLHEAGGVKSSRDRTTPFRFVEPIYGLGEWVGSHRLHSLIEKALWQYQYKNDIYVCLNCNNN